MNCLSFLYKGITDATLGNTEKLFNPSSCFIRLVKWESTIFEAVLVTLIDISSDPIVFFEIHWVNYVINILSLRFRKGKAFIGLTYFFNFFYTWMIILGWLRFGIRACSYKQHMKFYEKC